MGYEPIDYFDTLVRRGIRQVESAEKHARDGRPEAWSANALARAQRNFDRAVTSLGSPFGRYIIDTIAERVELDIEDTLIRGTTHGPTGIFSNSIINRGMSSGISVRGILVL